MLLFLLACTLPPSQSGPAPVDGDGDGYRAPRDCDDADSSVHPGAVETCDLQDEDCNGAVDDDVRSPTVWFRDADDDGYGTNHATVSSCEAHAGYILQGEDCDDTVASVWPGAPEHCDSLDNDCDGAVDEEAIDAAERYPDEDGDGYGRTGGAKWSCPVDGYVDVGEDCDDTRPRVSPGAVEVCGGDDENCDGQIDEPTAEGVSEWFPDADGDGFGADDDAVTGCDPDATHTMTRGGDCDDTDAGLSPDVVELCDDEDGLDNDCNGIVDDMCFSGTVTLVQYHPAAFDCYIEWSMAGTPTTPTCPGCEYQWDATFTYSGGDATCATNELSWTLGYGLDGSTPTVWQYQDGAWTAAFSASLDESRREVEFWAFDSIRLDAGPTRDRHDGSGSQDWFGDVFLPE